MYFLMNVDTDGIIVDGIRVVDFQYFMNQLLEFNNHNSVFECGFQNLQFVKEIRNGEFSTFSFECKMCKFRTNTYTSDKNNAERLNINVSAVAGMMGIGIREFFTALICHAWDKKLIKKFKLTQVFPLKHAAKEEKKMAKANGDVGTYGIPEITAVCDGNWAKRSYKTKYSSLSGAAAIIGYWTKKILYLVVKNKFCMVCARAENKELEPNNHTCFRNLNGSSTAIDAAIIAEGFTCSE